MLKGQVLEKESVTFKDGSLHYKILVSIQLEGKNLLQRIYSNTEPVLGAVYDVNLVGSDDLKYIKVKLGNILNSVENSDKKGIFNK